MTYYFPFLGIPCEPCNLGHVKHVDDDDDDADDDDDNDDDDDDENLRFFAISLIPISLEAPRKEGFLGLMVWKLVSKSLSSRATRWWKPYDPTLISFESIPAWQWQTDGHAAYVVL